MLVVVETGTGTSKPVESVPSFAAFARLSSTWALESYRVSYRVDLTGLPGTPSLLGKSLFLPGKSPCRVKAVETEGGPQGTKTAGIPQPFLTGVEVFTGHTTKSERNNSQRRLLARTGVRARARARARHFWIILGSCCDHVGIILESFWNHFGTILGSL